MSLPNEHEDEKPDEEECAICSNDLVEEFSRPEPCYHRFHTPCITTWAGIRLTCPMCREKFKRIFTYSLENKEHPKLTSTEVFEPPEEDVLEQIEMTTGINPYEHTVCHLCGGGDNEDQILLCDGCDEGFHMYCLSPAVTRIPSGTWMCPECSSAMRVTERVAHANHSVATRTAVLSRIAAIVARRLNIRSDSEDSEEEDDFSTMDAAVLNDNLEPGTSNLPPVERRKRKKAQSTGVKQRRKRRTKRQRKKENKLLKNLDEEQRRGSKEERAEVSRLSINGSRADYPFFEDEQQERSAPGSPDETESEKCDLLGSILSEQEKVLANGKLFKVEGGKFKETEEFEKYREKLHKKMDKQHKKRIGMPVEEEEQDKKEWQPSSSNAKEPNDGLMIDDREIDHEVEEQLAQMASDEREDRERELLDAQRKALADQKREELAKKVEKNRERERADREKKKLERDREKSQKEEAIIQLGRDRDRERKEREEKRGREREREDEKRRAREVEADKAKREVEEKRRRDRNERRRSRSRSPRRRDERRRGDRDRTSREVSRDDRNDRDENRHSRSDRNKDREKQRPSASTTVQMGQANGQAPPPSSNGALPRPFVPNQARPDMSAIFAAVPGLNPFLPNFGLQLANPTTQMLLAQQQQLVALGALPGGIPMPLPLTGNGIGLPGSIAPTQPTNQPSKGEESKRNEEDKKKGHAVKIIEGHSIRLVTAYFRKEKITREQYKNIMKQLVKEFRNSRSIDELKSAKCKEVIEERAKELLRPFD